MKRKERRLATREDIGGTKSRSEGNKIENINTADV